VVGGRWGDLMVDAVSPGGRAAVCGGLEVIHDGGDSLRAWPWFRAGFGLGGFGRARVAGHGSRRAWWGIGATASGGGSTARRAWLPWLGLWRPNDVLAIWPAAGMTPTAMDPASTATRLCLVVAGGSSAPLPPGGSRFGVGRGN
jgi:hypothetical protein